MDHEVEDEVFVFSDLDYFSMAGVAASVEVGEVWRAVLVASEAAYLH